MKRPASPMAKGPDLKKAAALMGVPPKPFAAKGVTDTVADPPAKGKPFGGGGFGPPKKRAKKKLPY